jgi:hypothetical protein
MAWHGDATRPSLSPAVQGVPHVTEQKTATELDVEVFNLVAEFVNLIIRAWWLLSEAPPSGREIVGEVRLTRTFP